MIKMSLIKYIYIYIYIYIWSITDSDYTDNIAFLTNTLAQAKTLLHSLEQAASGIHVNAHKTEYMCFNQRGDISTVNVGPLKLVDKFTYLRSSLINRERHQHKTSKRHGQLLVIWKSDLTDKIKRSFFPSSSHVNTAIWMHYMDSM